MDNLTLDILGSHPIEFSVGHLTGHMLADQKFGIGIKTVLYPDGRILGGAISYEDSVKLRDFLAVAIPELDIINSTYDWSQNDS